MTFVRRGADPYAVTVSGLKATAILSVGKRATETCGIPSFTRPTFHSQATLSASAKDFPS